MPDRFDLESLIRVVQAERSGGLFPSKAEMARLSGLISDFAGTADAAAAFDLYYDHWRKMPVTERHHPGFAGYLLQLVTTMRLARPCCTEAQARELAEAAMTVPQPEWQASIQASLVSVLDTGRGAGPMDPARLERAVEILGAAAQVLTPEDPVWLGIALSRAQARANRAHIQGGEAEVEAAIAELTALGRRLAHLPDEQAYLTCQTAAIRAERAFVARDRDAMGRHIRDLEIGLARLPRRFLYRTYAESWLAIYRGKLQGLDLERTGDPRPLPPKIRRYAVARPDPEAGPAALMNYAYHTYLADMILPGPESMDEAIGVIGEAMAQYDEDDEYWLRGAILLALAHRQRALALIEMQPDALGERFRAGRQFIADLDQSIALLRRCWRAAGSPAHSRWMLIGLALAEVLRTRATSLPVIQWRAAARLRRESRQVGLTALTGLAWSTILQSGTEHAMEAGARAMIHCLDVASWCIEDHSPAEAVRALDAGRALVLHAAQVGSGVPDMLTGIGEDGLAAEWRAVGGSPLDIQPEGLGGTDPILAVADIGGPDVRLRHRVLEALTASPYGDRLLSPPAPAEIAGALRTLGAEALVYLVPATSPVGRERLGPLDAGLVVPGTAVIVRADGTLRSLQLPELHLESGELVAYQSAGGAGRDPRRDAGPMTPPPKGEPVRVAGALDGLCAWAWRSTMARLSEEFRSSAGSPDRVPSLVLVPVGVLGAVPWHAAWRWEGRNRRYAVEELQISYTPSARFLCEVARRGPSEPGGGDGPALVIGNPTGDLRYAGEEAEAIHRVFYPEGTHLDAGVAGASEVSARLADLRGGVLHLACHARVEPGAQHSAYVELAAGSRLAAEELTEGAVRRCEPDLVCLAACWSNISGRGYDEAYSLATAFLSAGARTVLGSLWPVPDEATSLLMYMVHHFLRREALAPGPALRRAQLWMLDPRRRCPAEMPARLAVRARRIRPEDLAGWAGFTHQGW